MNPIRIVEVGPALAPVATRIIRMSLLTHYPRFMGTRHLQSDLRKRAWLWRETLNCTTSPQGRAFMAFKNNICVAVLTTIRRFQTLEIMSLFVLPGFTSDGIGSQLFDIARRDARKRGMHLSLNAMAANKRARRFYERQGGILKQRRGSGWGPLVVYGWEKP
jgi:ribosomal protein S18 acetylase RimI-like enzyme